MDENEPNHNEKSITVEGILEIANNKTGSLLDPERNGRTRPTDPFVPRELIRRFKMKPGNHIVASAIEDDRFPNP